MTAHKTPTRDELIALEKSYWEAVKAKDGKTTAALSGKTSIVTARGGWPASRSRRWRR